MAEYEDMEIICADCKKPFVFEAGEQRFYAERDFTPPKRCKGCRDERKARRNGGGGGAGRAPRRDSQPQHADDFNTAFGDVWEEDHRPRRKRRRRRDG